MTKIEFIKRKIVEMKEKSLSRNEIHKLLDKMSKCEDLSPIFEDFSNFRDLASLVSSITSTLIKTEVWIEGEEDFGSVQELEVSGRKPLLNSNGKKVKINELTKIRITSMKVEYNIEEEVRYDEKESISFDIWFEALNLEFQLYFEQGIPERGVSISKLRNSVETKTGVESFLLLKNSSLLFEDDGQKIEDYLSEKLDIHNQWSILYYLEIEISNRKSRIEENERNLDSPSLSVNAKRRIEQLLKDDTSALEEAKRKLIITKRESAFCY